MLEHPFSVKSPSDGAFKANYSSSDNFGNKNYDEKYLSQSFIFTTKTRLKQKKRNL